MTKLEKPNIFNLEQYIEAAEDNGLPPDGMMDQLRENVERVEVGARVLYRIRIVFPDGGSPKGS